MQPIALTLGLSLGSATAHSQETQSPPTAVLTPAPEVEPLPSQVKVKVRLMTGFEVDRKRPNAAQGGQAEDSDGFFLRQARLKLKGQWYDHLSYDVSFDLADAIEPSASTADFDEPPYVRNAYLNYKLHRSFQLRAGRFKRPFSRLELRGVGSLPIARRGLGNNLFIEESQWGDRAIGAMAWGKLKLTKLRWYLGAFNPAWAADRSREGVDVIGRLTATPVKGTQLGLSGGFKSIDTVAGNTKARAGGIDARLRYGGFELLGEFLVAELALATNKPTAFNAVLLTSYKLPLTPSLVLQPVLFGEYADADDEFSQNEALRLGIGTNLLIDERLRVMPQAELTRPVGTASADNPWTERTRLMLMLSLQL